MTDKQDKRALTPEEIKTIIVGEIAFKFGTGWTEENLINVEGIIDIVLAKAQLAHTLNRFKKALEQSRNGEPLDLSEEEFELFSAIQNDGAVKAYKLKLDRPELREKIQQNLVIAIEGYLLNLEPDMKCDTIAQGIVFDVIAHGLGLALIPDEEEIRQKTLREVFDKVEITILNELNQNLNNYPWWQALKQGKLEVKEN